MMSLGFVTGMPGWLEIAIIVFVILLLFGPKKLPELARSLGKSLSEFKKGREDGKKSTEQQSSPAEDNQEAKSDEETKD